MKLSKFYLIAALLCGMTACNSEEQPPVENPETTQEVLVPISPVLEQMSKIQMTKEESNANELLNEFSFKILQNVYKNSDLICREESNENISVSPLSAALCMAMTANTTNDSIYKVLGYEDIEALNSVCNKLLRYLPCENNGAKMTMANSVWYSNQYIMNEEYIDLMNNTFGAAVASYDLKQPQQSLNVINGWIYENTNGMIPSILQELNPELKMILINALYFSGAWNFEINKKQTVMSDFHGTEATCRVNMMKTKILTDFADVNYGKLVSIPFKGRKYRLALLLPDQDMDINRFSSEFTIEKWRELQSSEKEVEATIKFPRFEIEQSLNINSVLSSLGLNLFGISLEKAGILDRMNMNILQRTSMFVNEEGAKVAAVTVNNMDGAPGPGHGPKHEKVEITFNRPFMFFIENTETGSILMAGRVCNL